MGICFFISKNLYHEKSKNILNFIIVCAIIKTQGQDRPKGRNQKEENMLVMMSKFYCTVNVYGHDDTLLTKVIADSNSSAEHMILALGISGKHHYGVEACCAYDVDKFKKDCFIDALIHSEPIKFDDLAVLIEDANARIAYEDMLEKDIVKQRALIADIKRRIESLQEELEDEEDKLEEMMNK